MVRAGGAQDPSDKPGVASLAAALLDQGTTTRSAEQVAHTIDSIGGLIGTGSGTEYTFVEAIVMKDSFGVGLDLVSDMAKNPAFVPQEVELQRKQMLSSMTVNYDDPDYLAGVVFERLVYGPHRYGRPDSGTPASLAAITRDDLVAFHRTWFGGNNAILAVVGDVTTDEAFAGAEKAFGTWGKAASAAVQAETPPTPTRRLVIIDRPGAVQTEIRVGNTALPRKHPDYLALDLAIKILGGEGGNRLHRVLRSDRGLTYGVRDLHRKRHHLKFFRQFPAPKEPQINLFLPPVRMLPRQLIEIRPLQQFPPNLPKRLINLLPLFAPRRGLRNVRRPHLLRRHERRDLRPIKLPHRLFARRRLIPAQPLDHPLHPQVQLDVLPHQVHLVRRCPHGRQESPFPSMLRLELLQRRIHLLLRRLRGARQRPLAQQHPGDNVLPRIPAKLIVALTARNVPHPLEIRLDVPELRRQGRFIHPLAVDHEGHIDCPVKVPLLSPPQFRYSFTFFRVVGRSFPNSKPRAVFLR
jgi:hypothetical protein